MAARLGVSRTPIREALGRLTEYGVVDADRTTPRWSGAWVRRNWSTSTRWKPGGQGRRAGLRPPDRGRQRPAGRPGRRAARPGGAAYFDAFNEFDAERTGSWPTARAIRSSPARS